MTGEKPVRNERPDGSAGRDHTEQAFPVDTASRSQVKAALRETQQIFHQLVEPVRDYAIFLLDARGHVLTWNAGAKRLKGYTAEEIIGRHFSVFYPKEAVEQGWPEHELAAARKEGIFEDVGWRIRKDGSRFWASVVITPWNDGAGDLLGFS
jgi:PAS domain S-box-containing protein